MEIHSILLCSQPLLLLQRPPAPTDSFFAEAGAGLIDAFSFRATSHFY